MSNSKKLMISAVLSLQNNIIDNITKVQITDNPTILALKKIIRIDF